MKRTIPVTSGTVRTVVVVALFLVCIAWWSINLCGQDTAQGEANVLPPPRGEPLTLTPTDMPDVSCSVVKWKGDAVTPTLAVICPPQSVFAPLHVYLKLSWLKPGDVPLSARAIAAPEKTLIKIRTNKSIAWVWLEVRERQGAIPHRAWVAFNGVVDIGLLTLSSKR
jgi:hypothetical protein